LLGKSQASFGFLGFGNNKQDEWNTDTGGNIMFWVPNNHRWRLSWECSSGMPTELDLDLFKYGRAWAEYF
jgi:hypothetical protein